MTGMRNAKPFLWPLISVTKHTRNNSYRLLQTPLGHRGDTLQSPYKKPFVVKTFSGLHCQEKDLYVRWCPWRWFCLVLIKKTIMASEPVKLFGMQWKMASWSFSCQKKKLCIFLVIVQDSRSNQQASIVVAISCIYQRKPEERVY